MTNASPVFDLLPILEIELLIIVVLALVIPLLFSMANVQAFRSPGRPTA